MPKDYKKRENTKREGSPWAGNLLSFSLGLSLGVLVTFFVLAYYPSPASILANKPKTGKADMAKRQQERKQLDEPTFTFYQILPDREVTGSEWVAEDPFDQQPTTAIQNNVYLLQVGSFKDYQSADQIKAQLALMGIAADIQSISMNRRDIRHRVQIGPYKKGATLKNIKATLEEHNLEFITLKLKLKKKTT